MLVLKDCLVAINVTDWITEWLLVTGVFTREAVGVCKCSNNRFPGKDVGDFDINLY